MEMVSGLRKKRIRVTLALAVVLALALGASAQAAEIATPRLFKTAIQATPGPWGQRIPNKLVGETYLGNPLRLLVLEDRVINETRWLKVRLTERPNSSTAWLTEDQVKLDETDTAIVIDLSSRLVKMRIAGKPVLERRVIVGAPDTPTPTGQFAIYEKYRPGSSSDLRPWVLELSAHSNKLKTFNGGPGRVAMHGRHGALAAAPWGSAASHGCIRIPDSTINRIARNSPRGTPVLVKP